MCGIVGYAGKKPAAEIVYKGLCALEYRGYDSAGIAAIDNGVITVVKKKGRVCLLKEYLKDIRGVIGIGHTRWATHGKPSDINSHPHSYGKFTVVHNGIIENFSSIKEELCAAGENFISETDSEAAAHLLEKYYAGDMLEAMRKTCKKLKGSYALLAICADKNVIAVAKNKSPVVLGYSQSGVMIASDTPALAGECPVISILKDGDIAIVSSEGAQIFNKSLKPVRRAKVKNPAQPNSLGLNGCPHYMLKEIREVPKAIEYTYRTYFHNHCPATVLKIAEGADRIVIVGCGTAYNSGLVAKRYFEEFARIPAEVEIAGEFRYKRPVITNKTLVIAISQSGETADTIEAATIAKKRGAKVIAVTNAAYSAITRVAHAVVPVAAGAEICVAATKSYSGQIAALYLIALTLTGAKRDSVRIKSLAHMHTVASEAVSGCNVDNLAKLCAETKNVYFLGRDIDYAVALEGSLKLKEVSYIPCEGYPSGELKHGTFALIDENTVSVFVMCVPRLKEKNINAVEQILSRNGKVAIITYMDIDEELKNRVTLIKIPQCNEMLSPLISSIALQLLAYKTAVLLNRNPDKPRNLAKSVTVE